MGKKKDFKEIVYRPQKYDEPLAIDAVPSAECKRFHENSSIVFILPEGKIIERKNTPRTESGQNV